MKSFIVFALLVILSMTLSAKTHPCKVTKDKEQKVSHDVFVENEKWKCENYGTDAHSKYPVYFCTNKQDGTHIQVTYMDDGKKK